MNAQRLVPARGIEVKSADSEQGPATQPDRLRSGGILVLAVLAVIYNPVFGKHFLLPLALALVLKLLLQPAMRLLRERLRFPGAHAALLLIIAVFGAACSARSRLLGKTANSARRGTSRTARDF